MPSEGTVSAITAGRARPPTERPAGPAPAAPARSLVRTVPVAAAQPRPRALHAGRRRRGARPHHQHADHGPRRHASATTALPLAGPGSLPPHTDGLDGAGDRAGRAPGRTWSATPALRTEFTVPGDGAAAAAGGRLGRATSTCADEATGTVYVFDAARPLVRRASRSTGRAGRWSSRSARTTCSSTRPARPTARVVDDQHQVRVVDKYADDVLGGDPPPVRRRRRRRRSRRSRRSASRARRATCTAAAGNAEARVSWRPADAERRGDHQVRGRGRRPDLEVGADQRSVNVTGLTNGETYRFEVHAVNGRATARPGRSNPVRPTAEVPDPPTRVGRRGQAGRHRRGDLAGRERPGPRDRAVRGDRGGRGRHRAGRRVATAPELTVPDGELEYGKQYAFTVVSVNEQGRRLEGVPGQQHAWCRSPTPGAAGRRAGRHGRRPGRHDPRDAGRRRPTTAGRSRSTWSPPAAASTDVTGGTAATLDGFGDGETVTRRGARGQRGRRRASRGHRRPPGRSPSRTVTMTGASSTFNTATVTFSVDAGGGTAHVHDSRRPTAARRPPAAAPPLTLERAASRARRTRSR